MYNCQNITIFTNTDIKPAIKINRATGVYKLWQNSAKKIEGR